MGLSIIKRPYGYSLAGYVFPGSTTITNSSGAALFDVGTHGLSTGAVIYIYSSIYSYNGFWTITVISSTSFKLQLPQGGFVSFTHNSLGIYFKYAVSMYNHKWNCIHLPIIYGLQSTLWPSNTVDTSRTVSSFANDSNYAKLTCSGSLGTFNALQYVKISGANSSAVNGSWQILTKSSTSIITINLPYDATYDFTNGTIILYYNNYHVSINVWSGLNASHLWGSYNPYIKLTTINVVPDNNNIVNFNLNEYLKADVNILKNNLALDTLPNNTDFETQFYIEYQESYDTSDGNKVSTFTSGYTSDKSNFEGWAVNSKLPFKSQAAGAMTDYVFGYTTLPKFLTNFTQPSLFPGFYFDIAFLLTETVENTSTYLTQQLYKSGVYQSSTFTQVGTGTNNFGIYRFPVTQISNEDQQKISLGNAVSTVAPSSWTDAVSSWTLKDATTFTKNNMIGGTFVTSYIPFVSPSGTCVTISGSILIANKGGNGGILMNFYLADGSGTQISQTFNYNSGNGIYSSNGVYSITESIISSAASARLYIQVNSFSATGDASMTITPGVVAIGSLFSETKTIDINTKCYDQNYYLTWLNPLGGFDYWNFTGRSDHDRQINSVTTQQQNIFTNYPKSWSEFADTVVNESKRDVNISYVLRSQNLTKDQLDAVAEIKDSPLVQLITDNLGLSSRRTLLLDKTSFHIRKDGDKTFNISFTAVYTDLVSNQQL